MTIQGQPAYCSRREIRRTVSRHFRWMQNTDSMESWCNVFVVKNTQETHEGDVVLKNIMAAARSPGEPSRSKYDISGGNPATFAQTRKTTGSTW